MPTIPLSRRISIAASLVWKGWHSMFNKPGLSIDGAQGGSIERLTNAYAQSVWVMRAIKFVSQPIAAVPLTFTTGEREIRDPRFTEFWKAPAVGLTWFDFVEATVGWLKMSGEAFWVLGDEAIVPFPEQRKTWPKMIVARPDRMTEIIEEGKLVGWRFQTLTGAQVTLLPEQVIHLRSWNPVSDWRGQGELDPASVAVEADFMAGKFGLNLMRSNGDRGAYVVCKQGIPDPEQQKQIVAQLQQKRADAARGNFRPAFLTGDFVVEDPKIQALDTAVIASRLQNRHEIFIAFGVPPSMADIAASYSIGSASDRFRLIEDTCMPTGAKICGGIEQVVGKLAKLQVTAGLSWDDHSVMQQVRAERITSAVALFSTGMPMEQISEFLRLKLPEFDGWDTGYLPMGLSPAGEVAEGGYDPTTDPAYAEPTPPASKPEDDDEGEDSLEASKALKGAFDGRCVKLPAWVEPLQAEVWKRHEERMEEIRLSDKHVALWKLHMARRRATVKAFESKFNRVLMGARRETLHKIDIIASTLGRSPATVTKTAAVDLMFDLNKFTTTLTAAMRQVARTGLETAGAQAMKEFGSDDPWKMPDPAVLDFLDKRENLIKTAAQTVHGKIKDSLDEGITAGETMAELSKRVRSECNALADYEAKRIAMSETAAVYGEARQVAMEESSIEYKEWLSSGNDNVRETHQIAHGQIVKVSEPFIVGGCSLMQPGDSEGWPAELVPGETINCHCVAIATETKPES